MHGLGVEARMVLFHWDKGTDAGPAKAIGHSGAGAGGYQILGAAMSSSCSGAGSGKYYPRMPGAAWSQSTFRSVCRIVSDLGGSHGTSRSGRRIVSDVRGSLGRSGCRIQAVAGGSLSRCH
jgi:hypothetical protein